MRIKELIEALSKYDPEAQVITSNGSGSYEYNTIEPMYKMTTTYKNGKSDTMLVTAVQATHRIQHHTKYFPTCTIDVCNEPKGVYIVQNEEIQIPKDTTPS